MNPNSHHSSDHNRHRKRRQRLSLKFQTRQKHSKWRNSWYCGRFHRCGRNQTNQGRWEFISKRGQVGLHNRKRHRLINSNRWLPKKCRNPRNSHEVNHPHRNLFRMRVSRHECKHSCRGNEFSILSCLNYLGSQNRGHLRTYRHGSGS